MYHRKKRGRLRSEEKDRKRKNRKRREGRELGNNGE